MEFCYEELLLLSYLFIYCTHFLLFIYFILIGYVDAPVLTNLIKSIDLTLHFYLYLYEDAYYFMQCKYNKTTYGHFHQPTATTAKQLQIITT